MARNGRVASQLELSKLRKNVVAGTARPIKTAKDTPSQAGVQTIRLRHRGIDAARKEGVKQRRWIHRIYRCPEERADRDWHII